MYCIYILVKITSYFEMYFVLLGNKTTTITMSYMINDRQIYMKISVSQPGPHWFTNDEYAIGKLGQFNWQFMH